MVANDWDEIKRLAADFQRAQLSSTSHKLSERNCIEVVNKLISSGMIEVMHTIDGKEYLTPNQLEREIRDELTVHGGRINLVDLQQIIHVDLCHIEVKVNEMIHKDRFLTLINGELLDKDYLDRIAEEINESLQEAGQVAIADLAKTLDLPTEFMFSIIEPRLDVLIHGQLDPVNHNILFTAAFIAHNIAKIRGICSAVMRPIQVIQLAAQYGLSEKLFLNILETLISSERLSGTVQGGKENATYIPEIYSKTQMDYVDTFFKQNNYIEYHTLSRLGISDGRQYIKKRFSGVKDCIYLSTCCINAVIVDQIDAAIEDALSNDSWVDIKPLSPTPLTNEDINQLIQKCLKGASRSSSMIFCEHIVASKQFVDKCKHVFDPVMKNQAVDAIKTSPSLFAELTQKEKTSLTDSATGDGKQARKDERQKKAMAGSGQKGGSGRGSREAGTKKTKNKYKNRKGNDEDDDENNCSTKKQELAFMSEEQILEILDANMEDDTTDYDLLQEISSYLSGILAREYQEIAKSIFIETSASSSSGKRKAVNDNCEKINGLLTNIKLFEKGTSLFAEDIQLTLTKNLLKTLATDVINIIFEMVANEHFMSLFEDEVFSMETRLKLLKKLPDKWKLPLTKLNNSLTSKTLEDFYNQVDIVTGSDYCDIVQKKIDKKRSRQLLFNHRQSLMDQLDREMDPAMTLHLASVILFIYHTNTLLHAPGRCVPQIISFLQHHLSPADYKKLNDYQGLVIQQLGDKARTASASQSKTSEKLVDVEEETANRDMRKAVSILLLGGISDVKGVVKNMKKTHTEE